MKKQLVLGLVLLGSVGMVNADHARAVAVRTVNNYCS